MIVASYVPVHLLEKVFLYTADNTIVRKPCQERTASFAGSVYKSFYSVATHTFREKLLHIYDTGLTGLASQLVITFWRSFYCVAYHGKCG